LIFYNINVYYPHLLCNKVSICGLCNPEHFGLTMSTPTEICYETIVEAYDFFNKRLFEGQLPQCVITFQRQKRIMGFVSFDRWETAENEYIHELAINPEYFATYPLIEICQTLCHEMVHIWQANNGTPGRRGYHNKQWAMKMTAIGLIPSVTSEPGGAIVGEKVSDYILHEGPFMVACKELQERGFRLKLVDRYPVRRDQQPIRSYSQSDELIELTASLKPKKQRDETQVMKVDDSFPFSTSTLEDAFISAFEQDPPDNLSGSNHHVSSTKPNNRSNRHKYQCKGCNTQVWGKPELNIECGDCRLALIEVD